MTIKSCYVCSVWLRNTFLLVLLYYYIPSLVWPIILFSCISIMPLYTFGGLTMLSKLINPPPSQLPETLIKSVGRAEFAGTPFKIIPEGDFIYDDADGRGRLSSFDEDVHSTKRGRRKSYCNNSRTCRKTTNWVSRALTAVSLNRNEPLLARNIICDSLRQFLTVLKFRTVVR